MDYSETYSKEIHLRKTKMYLLIKLTFLSRHDHTKKFKEQTFLNGFLAQLTGK